MTLQAVDDMDDHTRAIYEQTELLREALVCLKSINDRLEFAQNIMSKRVPFIGAKLGGRNNG